MSQPQIPRPLPHQQPFATTRWTMVLAAADGKSPVARAALGALCTAYGPPLHAYVRHCGCSTHEAEDIVQGFFARLLEKGDLAHVARERGRFRSFLLAAIKHYLSNQRDHIRAVKRGGGKVQSLRGNASFESSDGAPSSGPTPEAIFDHQWALTLLELTRERLRQECAAAGKGERFETLYPLLAREPEASYQQIAAALRMSVNAVKVAVHRLRRRFGELLRAEIAETVAGPDDIDAEIRDLFEALRR